MDPLEYANPPAVKEDLPKSENDDENGSDERVAGTLFSKNFVRSTLQIACRALLTVGQIDGNDDTSEQLDFILSRLYVFQEICQSEAAALADFLSEDILASPLVFCLAEALGADDGPPEPAAVSCRLFEALAALTKAAPADGKLAEALARLSLNVLRWPDANALLAAFSALSDSSELEYITDALIADPAYSEIIEFVLQNSLRSELLAAVWRLFGRLFINKSANSQLTANFLPSLVAGFVADQRHGLSAACCIANAILTVTAETTNEILTSVGLDVYEVLAAIKQRSQQNDKLNQLINRLEAMFS